MSLNINISSLQQKRQKKAKAEPYLQNETNVNFADKSFSNCIILTNS